MAKTIANRTVYTFNRGTLDDDRSFYKDENGWNVSVSIMGSCEDTGKKMGVDFHLVFKENNTYEMWMILKPLRESMKDKIKRLLENDVKTLQGKGR